MGGGVGIVLIFISSKSNVLETLQDTKVAFCGNLFGKSDQRKIPMAENAAVQQLDTVLTTAGSFLLACTKINKQSLYQQHKRNLAADPAGFKILAGV